MGPLASQLAARYGRPSIAIAMDQQQGTGSGRSIPPFNLLDALQSCQDLLIRFGGHAQACGLTMDPKNLEPFRALVNRQAHQTLGREGLRKTRTVDLELPLGRIESRWVEQTERFAPFGPGNPRPSVLVRGVLIDVQSPRTAWLSHGTQRLLARGRFSSPLPGVRYDVAGSPAVEGGKVVLTVSDVRVSQAPSEPSRI
jgi:single-stranded-DNA-specific exonuclease